MRVFVTGATGFVGTAIVKELIAGGHTVVGLARSEKSAAALAALGASAERGALEDIATLKKGAREADAVIHAAFNHDWANYAGNCVVDARAIEALGEALEGTNKPLVVTATTLIITPGRKMTEEDVAVKNEHAPRVSEQTALAQRARGVRVSVVRLPPTVYGEGDYAFIPMLISLARQKGEAAYIGDGVNRWPAIHRKDAARIYRLIVESSSASGSFNAVKEEGVAFKDIASTISRHLGVALVSKQPGEEAASHFGFLAFFAALDLPTSNTLTRARLHWEPQERGLLQALDTEKYFD